MKLKSLAAAVLSLAFACGALGQSNNGGIKQDTKDAAHSAGRAAKKTGRKIKRGTRKTVNKGASATRKGAGKVQHKTKTPPQK